MPVFPDVDLTKLPKTHEAEVPEEYIDVMGHMNVAWYTYFFSEGMLGLFGHLGLEVDKLGERQAGSFALENHVRYFREVRLGHQIEVFSRLIARNEKRFHIINFMWNKSQKKISATSEIVSTSIDLRERRPTPIPDDVGVAMDVMIAANSQLDWEAPVCGVMGPR